MLRSLAVLLMLAGAAQAATFNFNGGGVVPTCPLTGTTYSCASLPNNSDTDVIIIASGYTVEVTSSATFSYNQGLQMSGTAVLLSKGNLNVADVNPANLKVTGGALKANGTFSAGAQAQTITADISAATINIGTGSTTKINGNLTATAGTITLASNVSVVGNVDAATVRIKAANSSVKGNINATTGLTIESNNTVNGNITGGTLTMDDGGVVINGNATMTGDVKIGSSGTINGDLEGRNVTTKASGDYISGNAKVNAIYLDYGARVGKVITCTGAAPGAPVCSCVTRADSNYQPTCGAAAPVAGPHHIQISHNGTALTCQPQTVGLIACANASCTAPHYTASFSGTLSPGTLPFTIAAGTGVGMVQQSSAGPATLSATSSASNASTCINTGSGGPCAMEFKTTGLTVTGSNHVSMTTATPTTVTIQALTAQTSQTGQTCVPLIAKKTVDITMSCKYIDPIASKAAKTPVKIGSSGSGVVCGNNTSVVQFSFDENGLASSSLQYAEVGQVGLEASYANANFSATGSGSFIAAPARFLLTATNAAGVVNGGPDIIFAKASAAFTVQVTAVNNDNVTTTNFGQENNAESIDVVFSIINPSDAGNQGAITTGAFDAIKSGVYKSASGSAGQWSFSDVGTINLAPKLKNSTTYYMGHPDENFKTKGSQNIGRFIPDHFDTVLVTDNTMDCATLIESVKPCAGTSTRFTHAKQPFFMKVLAYNGADPPTLTGNYAGKTLAKPITLSIWKAPGGDAGIDRGTLRWTAPNPANPTASADAKFVFAKGTGTGVLSYPAAPILPYFDFTDAYPLKIVPVTLYLRAIDTDGVSSKRAVAAASVEAPLTVVSGQLLLSNAHGSQTSPLPVEASAQYYMPSGYVFNPQVQAVSATKISGKIAFSGCQNKLDTGGGNCPATLTVVNDDFLTLLNGKGRFRLAPPTPALIGNGSVNVSLGTLFDYLPSATGRATFGIYRSGPVIYTREVHN